MHGDSLIAPAIHAPLTALVFIVVTVICVRKQLPKYMRAVIYSLPVLLLTTIQHFPALPAELVVKWAYNGRYIDGHDSLAYKVLFILGFVLALCVMLACIFLLIAAAIKLIKDAAGCRRTDLMSQKADAV